MDKRELTERLLDFGARCIRLATRLPKDDIGRHITLQLTRAATSAGANYSEACGAESTNDFVHKLQISLKELRETDYWLRLIVRIKMVNPSLLQELTTECDELQAILVAAITTTKRKRAN